jgi:hypothetical protein
MTTIINGSSPSVTFSDNTTQTTAGLPLTGGTITGNVTTAGLTIGTTALGAGNATRFKNRIINGDMYVAQRATSATLTAGGTIANGYATVDRFYGYCTGANVTMAQVAGSGNNKNLLRFTGAASVTAIGCGQRIESLNSYDLAGSIVTLSAYIANSLLTTVTWTAYYANTADTFGTLASPTRTEISTGTFTVNSTLTQYNAQITVPSAATTGIEIVFTVGAQTSGTWDIGLVQLELGSSATGFEYVDYTTQLAMCQRYFVNIPANYEAIAYYSDRLANGMMFLPVVMRTSPTVTGGSWTAHTGNAGTYAVANITPNYFRQYNSANNWTAGAICTVVSAVLVSAEL